MDSDERRYLMNHTIQLRMMVFSSLMTALIAIGGYLSFPIPLIPVPIVLADFFVMLAGLLLGAAWGSASVGLFLFLGALGMPVFAGGASGVAVFIGPTGGFLVGYLFCALVIGLVSGKGEASLSKDLAALLLGDFVLFGLGITWLKIVLRVTWNKALAFGLLPFIPGTAIKIMAAVMLVRTLRPFLKQVIPQQSKLSL